MKTIPVKEKTYQVLKQIKKERNAPSFDSLLSEMASKEGNLPKSLRGSLKGKATSFSPKDRENLWKDKYRDF